MSEHFSAKFLRQSTEALGSILQWIAELIAAKNWFNLLVLSAIALFFLGKPPGFLTEPSGVALHLLERLGVEVPPIYPLLFGVSELALLTSAVAIAVRAIPKEARITPSEVIERKAIKGLRPFNRDDAEVFAQLQRGRSLQECIESITSASFRFGILMGESGCGKTSFLQAGVWPQLTHETATHWGVYVRFSEREPIPAIAKALSEQLKIPIADILPEQINQGDLLAVLTRAVAATDKPLVLLLDQFEQFFVHAPRAADQEPFVQALASWYRSSEPLPVKILVAIRSDLLYQLSKLHQALGYALGPQEVFVLEKFTPAEAAKILAVIAQSEGLEFERRFVEELAEEALANREDGLISPVDLQILAWMIERQREDELRAFSRTAFQKFGGVEGLLTRFLERTLSARVVPGQRQAAMQVLLALTDLDRQVRAGVLTLLEMQRKLQATAKPAEVTEAVTWLVRGDVRLITPQERDGETGYELAHERLIPALIRQAGKELSAADKANQLLDRRVNEWLGNDCDRRWLLTIPELYLIGRQYPYLVWGAKHRQKQRLLHLSRQRVSRRAIAVVVIAGVLSGASSWLSFTPQGQIMQIEWQLSRLAPQAHVSVMAQAAVAWAMTEQWPKAQQVIKLINRRYAEDEGTGENRDRSLASFINQTANFLPKLDDKNQALLKLQQELSPIVKTLEDDWYKSQALSSLATTTVKLNDGTQAAALLQAALQAAQTLEDDGSKSQALSSLAYSIGAVNEARKHETHTSDLLAATVQLLKRESASAILKNVAIAYAQQEQWGKALHVLQSCGESDRRIALIRIMTLIAEKKTPTLIEGAVVLKAEAKQSQTEHTLQVTIQSPDRNCGQYTDWWEIITPEGELKGRETFHQPHLDHASWSGELTLSADAVKPDQTLLIRAHFKGGSMNSEGQFTFDDWSSGYTNQALQGTIQEGFHQQVRLPGNFALWLEDDPPQPTECKL